MAIISKLIEGLTNDAEYFVRVFPINHKGFAQSELDGQVVSAIPIAGLPLSTLAEGAIVMIPENGVAVPFYLAKHDYESGLNGSGRTLLVRKDCYDFRKWNSSKVNIYASSEIDAWLNGVYINILPNKVRDMMGETSFYCTIGNGNWEVSTLKRAAFLLSPAELGFTNYNGSKVEGSPLPIATSLRIACLNGDTSYGQWQRTAFIHSTEYACYVTPSGTQDAKPTDNNKGSRPCFTLPSTAQCELFANPDGSYNLLV